MRITEEIIATFRLLVEERFGLHFDGTRTDQLVNALRDGVTQTKSPSADAYVEALRSGSGVGWDEVIERLTVAETYFFRVPEHFAALQNFIIPALVKARDETRHLRILSLGCASGEEPYTIAMLLGENSTLAGWNINLMGVDVNPAVLAKADAGRYTEWSLRETPAHFRERYFRKAGKREYQLADSIRGMVRFEQGNLHGFHPGAGHGAVDVIFMRNVLMYFAENAARNLLDQVAETLAPDGYLFVAPAESLRGISQRFRLCHTDGTFYYRVRPHSAEDRMPVWPQEIATQQPESTEPWYEVVQRSTERIQALRHARKDVELTPLQFGPTSPERKNVAIAMELYRAGDAEAAWKHLKDAPELGRDPDATLLAAVLLTNAGSTDEAEEQCRRILASDDLNAGAHYLLALCREQKGDRSGAIEQDDTASYIDPTFAMPFLHRGLLARRAGDVQKACRELKRALELLASETSSRILLFGGGFGRESLFELCQRGLRGCGHTK